jgi:transposase
MEVVRLYPDKKDIERGNFSTNETGKMRLKKWLKPSDTVLIEVSSGIFLMVKEIIRDVGCEVLVLNPGDLAVIYRSLKKTDKEDALKLARLGLWIPREKLPVVPLPTDEEEDWRRLVSEHTFYTEERTRLINRLHSIYHQAGKTMLTKKDLKTKEFREKSLALFEDRYREEARRLMVRIDGIEDDLEHLSNNTKDILSTHLEIVSIYMSMVGIGPVISLALLAHLAYFERFSKAKQVSNFIGLTPKIDQSGDKNIKGETTNRGCQQVRRVIVQGAWALVRSKNGGVLKDKFERICAKSGKYSAIIAVAREMMEILFHMVKRHEYYRGVNEAEVMRKMRYYGLIKNFSQGA